MSQTNAELLNDFGKLRIRNAIFEDFSIIQTLLVSGKNHYFGSLSQRKCDTADCFFQSYATHRMIVFDTSLEQNTAIGYAEFANFPCIVPLPRDCWLQWINHHYCTQLPLSTANTLFFNYFVYSSEHVPDVLLSVLRECFLREQKLRYIIAVEVPEPQGDTHTMKTSEQQHYYILEKFTKVFYPREFNVLTCRNIQHLHIIYRDKIIYNLRYRLALPEDNDDCVEIIDKERPKMRQEYGDFYIAEQLLNADNGKDDYIIITEMANVTAGFLWLKEKVDVVFLARNWELEDFGHLVKFNSRQTFKQLIIQTSVLVKKSPAALFTCGYVQDILSKKYCTQHSMLDYASTDSISSKFILQVISNSGIITTSNEEYHTRQPTIKRMQIIDELFHNIEYYVSAHKKYIRLSLNVPDDYSGDDYNDAANIVITSNAFALHLFGVHDFIDLRRIQQFIATAFNAFPDRDYCVLSLQCSTNITKPLLELLKYFVRIPPRVNCQSDESLYITYRGAIYGDLIVHPVRECDMTDIENLLLQVERKSPYKTPVNKSSVASLSADQGEQDLAADNEVATVRRILQEVLHDPIGAEYVFMSIRCGNAARPVDDSVVVGYAVLRRFPHTHALDTHFRVPYYSYRLDEAIAEVITLKLHPCFHYQVDAVFRELARQTEFWNFIYISPVRCNFLPLTNDLLRNMQPVEPRRIKKALYSRNVALPDEVDGHISYLDGNYAAFQMNLCPSQFFGNHEQIVILGFTDTTKAFLRSLIFSWNTAAHVEYTKTYCCLTRLKVLVIAKPGVVEAEYDDTFKCAECTNQRTCWMNFQNSNAFVRDVTKRIDLRIWVDFISGCVKHIDTEKRLVQLANNCEVFYETLLIFCDTDYGPPHAPGSPEPDVLPANYAHINNRLDKITLYHKLEVLRQSLPEAKILLHGSRVLVYEFISFLLQHDRKPHCISLVLPYLSRECCVEDVINNPCQDGRIESILLEMVEDLGVMAYDAYNFSHWLRYPDDESIRAVVFKRNVTGEPLEISCDFFVSFQENYMDTQFAKVLEASDIALRANNILVNKHYQTSAQNVYALGKCIQHTYDANHQYVHVSPREAAEQLIYILGLSQHLRQPGDPPFDGKFTQPHYFQAQLPMRYYMANIMLPKCYLANHLSNSYGSPMTTYNGDFCRVRLNENGIVEQILCVVKNNICLDYLQYFVGKHEALLNNLRPHWFLDEIECFLKFFQEPWTQLITHDQFEKFRAQTRATIYSTAEDFMTLGLERNYRKELFRRYLNDLNITKEVQGSLLEFLRKHRNDFPYAFALPEDFVNMK